MQSVDVLAKIIKICSSQSNVFSGKLSCIFLPLPRNNVNYYVVYLKDVSCSRFRIGGSEELWGTVGHRYPRPVVRTPGDGAILYIVNINIFQQQQQLFVNINIGNSTSVFNNNKLKKTFGWFLVFCYVHMFNILFIFWNISEWFQEKNI